MPQPLTAAETRAPSSPLRAGTKIAFWTTAMGYLLPLFIVFPPALPVAAVGGFAASLIVAIGKSVRDNQHSYEAGGKRAGTLQNGFLEGLLDLIGSVF